MSSPKTRLTAFERHRRTFGLQIILLIGLAALPFLLALTRVVARPWAVSKATNTKGKTINLARLSQSVSVRAAGRGNPTINLSDGREVLTVAGRSRVTISLVWRLTAGSTALSILALSAVRLMPSLFSRMGRFSWAAPYHQPGTRQLISPSSTRIQIGRTA